MCTTNLTCVRILGYNCLWLGQQLQDCVNSCTGIPMMASDELNVLTVQSCSKANIP